MKRKNESEYFILQLLITDILYVVTMPFWIYSAFTEFFWPFGVFVCKFASGLFYLGMYGMTFFIAALSIDRYLILFASNRCKKAICNLSAAKKISTFLWVRQRNSWWTFKVWHHQIHLMINWKGINLYFTILCLDYCIYMFAANLDC